MTYVHLNFGARIGELQELPYQVAEELIACGRATRHNFDPHPESEPDPPTVTVLEPKKKRKSK